MAYTMYDDCKIFGPYKRKDGRMHIILQNTKGKLKTISYPKYLIELHIGRYLEHNETVDHIDRDFENNSISNLRIIERSQHAMEDHIRVKDFIQNCIWCNKELIRSPNNVINNARKGKAGPFCRSCAGKYGILIQQNKIQKLSPQPEPEREYYYITKMFNGGMAEQADATDFKEK